EITILPGVGEGMVLRVAGRGLPAAAITGHIESTAWLARQFLGAEVSFQGQTISISGVGFRKR
ncbi:MAG TPA: hypothetical protein VHP35_12225, partial [Terriglobia bacterium]|nr:hypothetical protein [Terriglobia bacterium]